MAQVSSSGALTWLVSPRNRQNVQHWKMTVQSSKSTSTHSIRHNYSSSMPVTIYRWASYFSLGGGCYNAECPPKFETQELSPTAVVGFVGRGSWVDTPLENPLGYASHGSDASTICRCTSCWECVISKTIFVFERVQLAIATVTFKDESTYRKKQHI